MVEQSYAVFSDGISPEVARRRIASFKNRFGEEHLYLAQHAAFPLAITPDLLYHLWANFQRDIRGERLNIPWIAVADLLLSGLFDEVGHELYEMDVVVRSVLISDLKANPNFGQQRIIELSYFLSRFIEHQLRSHNPHLRHIATAQKWTVLAYSSPSDAARELALALRSSLEQNDKAEQVRMASIIDTFSEPLAEFVPLLTYARGVGYLAQGDTQEATAQFKTIGGVVNIAGIKLQVPINLNRKGVGAKQDQGPSFWSTTQSKHTPRLPSTSKRNQGQINWTEVGKMLQEAFAKYRVMKGIENQSRVIDEIANYMPGRGGWGLSRKTIRRDIAGEPIPDRRVELYVQWFYEKAKLSREWITDWLEYTCTGYLGHPFEKLTCYA